MTAALSVFEPDDSLEGLAAKADAEATAVEQIGSEAVKHAWQCGRYLLEAKERVGRGEFSEWLSVNWVRAERAAWNYMRISEMLNLQRVADLTSVNEALRICQQEQKPKIRERVIDALSQAGDDGLTDSELADLLQEKGSSIRGRRSELFKEGLVKPTSKKRGEGNRKQAVWVAVESDEDAERARQQAEKQEVDNKADKLADKILNLDHRTRAAVMRRVNSDEKVKQNKIKQIAKDQRYGDGTPKDHVRTCVIESYHRICSAVQQNGPGTNRRWISTCSEDERRELRIFAENLSSVAKTLSDYLNEEL